MGKSSRQQVVDPGLQDHNSDGAISPRTSPCNLPRESFRDKTTLEAAVHHARQYSAPPPAIARHPEPDQSLETEHSDPAPAPRGLDTGGKGIPSKQ